jgi:hypothetical protein
VRQLIRIGCINNPHSPEQRRNGLAAVGDGDGTQAVEEFVGRVDAEGGVNRGVEVGDGKRVLDDLLAEFVGDTLSTVMLQATVGHEQAQNS